MKNNGENIMAITVKFKPEVQAMLESAPEFDIDPNPGGKPIARSIAEFEEYLKKKDRTKVKTPIKKTSTSIMN